MPKAQALILRREEHKDVLTIPLIVRIAIPRIKPLTVIIAVQFQQLRVAVRVSVYKMPSLPLPFEVFTISRLYRIRHHNALAFYTKYLHFLKCLHKPRYLQPEAIPGTAKARP